MMLGIVLSSLSSGAIPYKNNILTADEPSTVTNQTIRDVVGSMSLNIDRKL